MESFLPSRPTKNWFEWYHVFPLGHSLTCFCGKRFRALKLPCFGRRLLVIGKLGAFEKREGEKKGVLCVHATGEKIRNGSLLSAGNSEGEELFNFLPLKIKEEGACRALGRKCGKRGQVAKKYPLLFLCPWPYH